jgi:hypothetical protein
MTRLIYTNYLKDKYFNINEQYYERFKFKENKFEKLICKAPFDILFMDIEFTELLIKTIESRIEVQSKIIPNFRESIKQDIQKIFNYEGDVQRLKITPFFTNNFNFITCFYCNKDFINNFEENTEKLVSTFQLDHFYDKGDISISST